ncbi:hypothetical protein ACO0QE_002538 [Hanseniaspora vineae]
MKKEVKILLYLHLFFISGLVYIFFDILNMIVDDPLTNAITDEELSEASNDSFALQQQQLIPKIIHQTYKTNDIPEHWKAGQQACIDLHPDYEYKLWTDDIMEEFMRKEYPWFLDTYLSYGENIQRADAIRYFILYHYGGIYIDLDDGCQRKLDPLLKYPSFFRKTSPLGISNDVIGSKPGHPLMLKLTKKLKGYNINYFNVPYWTIMASTGPMFVSMIWEQYKRNDGGKAYKILQPHQYKNGLGSFFKISEGSSWHSSDSNFIFKMGAHILGCVVFGFIVFFIIFYMEYIFYKSLQNFSLQECANSINAMGQFCAKLIKSFVRVIVLYVINPLKGILHLNSLFGVSSSYQQLQQSQGMNENTNNNNNSSKNNKTSTDQQLQQQYRRLRKDSNLPVRLNLLLDLEKNGDIENL